MTTKLESGDEHPNKESLLIIAFLPNFKDKVVKTEYYFVHASHSQEGVKDCLLLREYVHAQQGRFHHIGRINWN